MKKLTVHFALMGLCVCGLLTAEQKGIQRLVEGNERYVHDQLKHPNRTPARREYLLSKQNPFAVIVGCADSRVSPEIIFDQGIGDLFVVRVAGNVIGPLELDSIIFSAVHLGSSVILVLGHENCGAVQAVMKGTTADIPAVAKMIKPAVQQAEREKKGNASLETAVKINALRQKKQLLQHPAIRKLVQNNKLQVKAGYYHLESGKVELLK